MPDEELELTPAATFVEFKAMKALEDGTGGFEGYGAVFGNRDLGGDIMRPGSVKNVAQLKQAGFIAGFHEWDRLPIGYIEEANQDATGLYLKTVYHSHPEAQAARGVALERLAAGKTVGLSIGYQVLPGGSRMIDDSTRELMAVEVIEVSQVNAAMNPLAQMVGAKGSTAQHEQRAQAAVSELHAFVSRLAGYSEARRKEGRVLSTANRNRLQALLDAMSAAKTDIEKLLQESEPDKSMDGHRLYAEFLKISAQLNGVKVNA